MFWPMSRSQRREMPSRYRTRGCLNEHREINKVQRKSSWFPGFPPLCSHLLPGSQNRELFWALSFFFVGCCRNPILRRRSFSGQHGHKGKVRNSFWCVPVPRGHHQWKVAPRKKLCRATCRKMQKDAAMNSHTFLNSGLRVCM